MGRGIRNERWYVFLEKFLKNESMNITSVSLFKSEVNKLEKHLKENEIPVMITDTTKINSRECRITLEKM